MAQKAFTRHGNEITLGRELGRGGEGAVFELPGRPIQVAKLYHKLPDKAKQAKLEYMAQVSNEEIQSYAAWPQETIHSHRGGPVTGFLMAKVASREPIHMIYSPAHRRQEHPSLGWNFLVYAARNTAAAFAELHRFGHVLADVNQGNVMVGANSKIVLIDCDSYQVNAAGKLHFCEVGVGHFTPPELQGVSSFRGVTRTPNHDNFGLALLIFHLLFGGRHPFAGLPLRRDVGESLEEDIKLFRFAYSRSAQKRGTSPPPNSIPASIIPEGVWPLFEAAFTETGSNAGRPTAQHWVTALDSVRKELRTCGTTKLHVYPASQKSCPWCELEIKGVVYFPDANVILQAGSTGFALSRLVALVQVAQRPDSTQFPPVLTSSLRPAALPPGAVLTVEAIAVRATIVIMSVVILVALPKAWWAIGAIAWISWAATGSDEKAAFNSEKRRRRDVLTLAQREHDEFIAKHAMETGPEGFDSRKALFKKTQMEYGELDSLLTQKLNQLHSTAEARKKAEFLDKCFIDQADISGVGPSKKAALRSYGIETAADVTSSRVRQVRGFGDVLTRAVVDWRKSCERRFVFDPRNAVTEQDKNKVRNEIAVRKQSLEAALTSCAKELQGFKAQTVARATAMRPAYEKVSLALAQAKLDLSIM